MVILLLFWIFSLKSMFSSWVYLIFLIIMVSGILLMLFYLSMLMSGLFKLKGKYLVFMVMFLFPNFYFFKNYFFSEMSLNMLELNFNNLSLILFSLMIFLLLLMLISVFSINTKFYRQIKFLKSEI
uniref:NADH dehydrogenase subunit 6 n=1 Tax=Romanomermis nielseni TaxID=416167 RepID=A1Z396_9BILA|nr:NADH dehydrogenase subunit 6 [Romanomermis nielseni]ABL73779.1 NADH dehydrogenase subunit 6 [Romanomermis nielseni]